MDSSERLRELVCGLTATLAEAMQLVDANGLGVIFILDADGVVKGLLTDGDIRRAFLKGAALSDAVELHVNRRFVAGAADALREQNLSLMSSSIRHLPLLDETGRLRDFISWRDVENIPLISPSLLGNELRYVQNCIAAGWLSSQGPYIQRFEESFCAFVGTDYALCVANGTIALQLALQALDVGSGDEVIVPDFTFGASANAIMQRGARPVFVDVDPDTWTIDPALIEAAVTPQTKAIMPVHIYGHPCDMDPIVDIARRRGLKIVEDCAQALGAEYKGRPVGSIGDIGCFSFFANKIITTGEGGMCTTNDPRLADRLTLLRDHGMHPQRRYWHLEVGTNGRMTNLQAAVGLGQIEQISRFLSWRDRLAAFYDEALSGVPGISFHVAKPWARKVTWLYTVTLDNHASRDALIDDLKASGIECRPTFPALHDQPAFAQGRRSQSFPVSERLGNAGVSLPTGNQTSLIEAMRVSEELRARLTHSVDQRVLEQ